MNKKNTKILWIVGIIIVAFFVLRSSNPGFFAINDIPGGGTCTYDQVNGGTGYSQIINTNSFTCQYEKCVINARMVVSQPAFGDAGRRAYVVKGPVGSVGGPFIYTPLYVDVNQDGRLEGFTCSTPSTGDIPSDPRCIDSYPTGWYNLVGSFASGDFWITSNGTNVDICVHGGNGGNGGHGGYPCIPKGDSISSTPTRNCDAISEFCTTDTIYAARFNLCPPAGELQTFCPGNQFTSTTSGTLSQTYYSQDIKLNAGETVTFNPQYITGEPVVDKTIYVKNCKSAFLQILSTKTQYNYGDTVTISVKFSKDGVPQSGVRIDGTIGGDKASASATTVSDGTANLNFINVQATGNLDLILTSQINGEPAKTEPKTLTFSGQALIINASKVSPQSSPVTFYVSVADIVGPTPVTSQSLTNQNVTATLSNGKIISSDISMVSTGLYKISSIVNGTGAYIGKFSFYYQNKYYESEPVQITVSSAEGQKRCDGKQPQILYAPGWTDLGVECYVSCNPSDASCVLETGCTQHSDNGACLISGVVNSYTCRNKEIWYVDANGQASKTATCGLLDNSYCSEGISTCRYCEPSQYLCQGKTLYQCLDSTTAAGIVKQKDCEAGCFQVDNQFKCDDLVSIIGSTQNFFLNENIIITGVLKGSSTGKGVQTGYSARITGIGVDQSSTGSSDVNGNININFGSKPIGTYSIVIALNDYPSKSFTIQSKVTNDYKIRISGEQTLLLIPNAEHTTVIEALDKQGGYPDGLIVVQKPTGITAVVNPTTINGKWNLVVTGDEGIYRIQLAAVKNGVTLDSQEITIELATPKLQISSNIPVSAKSGKHTYDINIVGPTASSQTTSLEPQIIRATLSGPTTKTLDLLKLGSGAYTFEQDFVVGTSTINIEATLDGYQPATYSTLLEISGSGTSTPNGNISDPDTVILSTCGDKVCQATESSTTCPGDCAKKSYWIYIIGGVAVILIFLLISKKRRRK
jgi:hypothetical protein